MPRSGRRRMPLLFCRHFTARTNDADSPACAPLYGSHAVHCLTRAQKVKFSLLCLHSFFLISAIYLVNKDYYLKTEQEPSRGTKSTITLTRGYHPRPRPKRFQERCLKARTKSWMGNTSARNSNMNIHINAAQEQ